MTLFSVGDMVTWRFWGNNQWWSLMKEYGDGPFIVKEIYNTDVIGHPQVLILKTMDIGEEILQKKGYSPETRFSGKILKKVFEHCE